MSYDQKLIYFGSIQEALAEGWEPTPHVYHVIRYVGQMAQTWVWMRRPK